jgi:DDE family transposase
MCDSLSIVFDSKELSDGDDGGVGFGTLRRQAPAKKGRQALERMRLRGTVGLRTLADRRAEQVGFARFFHNPRVMVEEILATATARTAAAAGRHVLLIGDTSEINYEAKAGRKRGLGRVGNGTDVGLFIHPVLAIDAEDGTVLGLAGAKIWRRRSSKRRDYQERPIETKESYRWLETIAAVRPHFEQSPLVTVIADREADIFEFLVRVPDARTHVLIRAAHNRAIGDGGRLFTALGSQPEAGRATFDMPARDGRPARTVDLAVRFAPMTLRQPRRGADPRDPKEVTVNAVEVREIDPAAKDPVHWRLLTTHPVASLAGAMRIVELYRRRWAIEQLFRTLKSQAIDIEASLIEDGAALERLAAAALVAATMVMQLVHARGEAGWTLPAARVFSPSQIAALRALTPQLEGKTAKQKNPHRPQSLAWAAWHIARLGGWTGYASERPPGPITFSRGLQRFNAIVQGFDLAQSLLE